MSLHPCFHKDEYCRFPKESFPTEIGKGRHWTSVFVCGCASNAKGQPKAIFKWKNSIEQMKLLSQWMKGGEGWMPTRPKPNMCHYVLTLHLISCAEKDSLCGRVMSHNGLNLTCLDQCHGVRFHGGSTSQGWRKRLVIQSRVYGVYSLNLIHKFTSLFRWRWILAGFPRKAFARK